MGAPRFLKPQERPERLFRAEYSGVFFSAQRVENCSTLDQTLCSSLSLSSQPTNQSGGWAELPTILRLNNNGEVNIAFLRVFIFFTRWNCRTTIILGKIMLGEIFNSWRICHVSNHRNHSVSMGGKKKTLRSQALTAERFLLAKRFCGHAALVLSND